MQLFKTIRLIRTFYGNFFLASLLINACCFSILRANGLSAFAGVFWLKTASLALTWYFISDYKNKEFYYYQNLGVSKTLLWAATLSFDFILFILLIILTYQLK